MSIFEGLTPETIRNRILEQWAPKLQTREGSFCYDAASPISFEIWRLFMTLEELIEAFYVTEHSGKYLDSHAALLGLARRQGTKAAAQIRFSGTDGVIVPAGTVFYTETGLQFVLSYDVTLEGGEGEGYLQAVEPGGKYNVPTGEIVRMLNNIPGLHSFENTAAIGGADPESDADLFGRIDYRRKHPSTSGNENHYKEWAVSCAGVGAAKAERLWAGPGTVRVLLAGYDGKPVDDDVVNECAKYIETQRPVGAAVTVVPVEGINISVSAEVSVDETVTAESVKAQFASALGAYLQETVDAYFDKPGVAPYAVYYNRIASLLMGIPGVIDFRALSVNGGEGNIEIPGAAVPVLGEVTVV